MTGDTANGDRSSSKVRGPNEAPHEQTAPPLSAPVGFGKADPPPDVLVLFLAFFTGGGAGYFLALFAVGLVAACLGRLDAHLGHLGALQMNLSGLAWACLGVAAAMAWQGRPIRGFAVSAAATLAVSGLIAFKWRELALRGYEPEDVVVFLGPLLVSSGACAASLVGLTAGIVLLVRRRIEPGSPLTGR